MRYLKICSIVALSSLASVFFSASAVQALSSQLTALKSYQANFVQKSYDGKQLVASSAGTMALKRPGYFRWERFKPTHQIIIVSGHVMQTYDVDLAQVTTQKLTAQQQAAPAVLLSGSLKSIEKDFVVSEAKKNTFKLLPKKAGGFKSLTFIFKHNELIKMILLNSLGQLNVYQFSHIKFNHYLSAKLFKLNLPKGVTKI